LIRHSSARVLTAALGVDPTAVYRYFRTKDELLPAMGFSATPRCYAPLSRPPGSG